VFVEGRFRSRSYTAKDGSTRAVNEVADARVLFLDRAGAPAPGGESEGGGQAPAGGEQAAGGARKRAPVQGGGDRRGGGDDVEELPW
jgi:single-stranded DNA-binding protein